MIKLIEGRSGSGKTRLLRETAGELAKNGCPVMYLIPEQCSFECETAFLRLLGPKDARAVKVMSFTRMYNFVMRETGGAAGVPIDDSVRRLIMSCTLEDCAGDLEVYGKQALRPAFTEMAVGAVKELKRCGILPDELRKKATAASSAELGKKLRDISHIYAAYDSNVAQSGVDPYDNDIRLEKRIAETKVFSGYTVFIDDFTGFTAQQQRIVELLMEQCADMYISLCREPLDEEELFFTVNRTRKRLIESAQKLNKQIGLTRLSENHRTEKQDLLFLEENIYRKTEIEQGEDGLVKPENITAVCASDVYDECEYIAAKISELVMSEKCRYRDIAVVFRKSERYDGIIDSVFDKYGISYFMSKPQPVESKPLMRLAVTALEYTLSRNDGKKLMAAAKTGLMGVSPFDTARLENYVFVWSVKGRQFFEPFTENPGGYSDKTTPADIAELESINQTRLKITAPFKDLTDALTSDSGSFTAKEISTAVYNFLTECGVDVLLKGRADECGEFSSEELRLWDVLMDILGKMHDALGDRRVTVSRYLDLFKTVLRGTDISDIPQTLDQVLIGKADSVRFSKPYAVFVIGAVDGEFPHIPVSDGVWSDAERKDLISLGLPLYDSLEDLFRQENLLVYNAVSAPSDMLFVTYPKGTLSGGKSDPSSIVSELFRIFPTLELKSASELSLFDRLVTNRSAFELYAKNLSTDDGSAFMTALGKYLGTTKEYGGRTESLGANIKNLSEHISDANVTRALFGKDKHLSATQIENFYKCPFAYFCEHGIHLKDRSRAEIDSLMYGNLMHYLIKNVIDRYIARSYAPFSDKELGELLDELLDKYLDEELGGKKDKSERFRRVYYRTKKRVWNVLSNMFAELSETKFEPVDAELRIGYGDLPEYSLKTEKGGTISVKGFVDRVDIMKTEDKSNVRIIDYKSSDRKFSIDGAVYGLNLQMLVYLAAILENSEKRYGDDLSAAAIFYMKHNTGSVTVKDAAKLTDAEIERTAGANMVSGLRLKGIYVNEPEVIDGLSKSRIESADNSAIPVEKLLALISCVKDKIRDMSDKIDGGEITALPTKKSSGSLPCDYCAFIDICRREKSDRYVKVSKDKAAEKLEEYEKKGDGADEKV